VSRRDEEPAKIIQSPSEGRWDRNCLSKHSNTDLHVVGGGMEGGTHSRSHQVHCLLLHLPGSALTPFLALALILHFGCALSAAL
jgi:hypothetical protein